MEHIQVEVQSVQQIGDNQEPIEVSRPGFNLIGNEKRPDSRFLRP